MKQVMHFWGQKHYKIFINIWGYKLCDLPSENVFVIPKWHFIIQEYKHIKP